MIDKLAGLWNTNKWLFFILLPLTLLSVAIKLYLEYNAMKAEQELKGAQDRDDKLKAEQDKLNAEANEHKATSDKLEEDIKKRNEDKDLDLDWHEK